MDVVPIVEIKRKFQTFENRKSNSFSETRFHVKEDTKNISCLTFFPLAKIYRYICLRIWNTKKKQRMFLPSLVCVFRNLLSSYYTLDSSRRSSPSQQLPSERETRRGSINQSIESVTREWIQTLSPLTQLFQLRHLRRLLHLNNSTLSQRKSFPPQKKSTRQSYSHDAVNTWLKSVKLHHRIPFISASGSVRNIAQSA